MNTKRTLSLMLILIMLLSMATIGAPALASRTPTNWAVPEMTGANTSGLLTPSAANDFQRALTRDEFCELVVNMVELTLGEPLPLPAYNPFVDDTDPISIHALKAFGFGIITGVTTTKFAPEDNVVRIQLCTMMIRAIKGLEKKLGNVFLKPGIGTLPYKDAAKIQDYAADMVDAVKIAYTNNIMHGNDYGNFLPRDNISSEECVAVIFRSFNNIEDVRTSGMTNAQLLDMAFNRVHIGYAYGESSFGVSKNLTLPTESTGNATVTWTSSDSTIIGIAGEIGVVNAGNSAKTVTLTARVRVGGNNGPSRDKIFKVTTSPYTDDRLLLENAVSELDILYLNEGDGADSVTGRIGLPTKVLGLPVSWRSNNPTVVSTTGDVNVPSGIEPRSATLTATITMGSQTRTKAFNLTVLNPDFSRGVMLHDVYFGLSQSQVTKELGTVRRTITASSTESWQLYYNNSNYSNFIAVAFISNRAVAVYSMASNAANQLRNREGTVITTSQANAYGGVSAVSCIDPGDSSKQYAILIYDSTSVIGKSRSLLADGQEELLFELVNAFRARNGKSILAWTDRLGAPARVHSNNRGSGNLRDRVVATSNGFDSGHYIGGNIVSGDNDAFEALDQIIDDSSGSSSMRSQILQSSATMFGAGFSGGNSGSVKTYYTYALGNAIAITGFTSRVNDSVVTTVNVSVGSSVTVALTMAPSTFNETFTVTSSNTSRMTVKTTTTTAGANVTVTGVSSGSADIVITGNSSGKSYTRSVSVGAAVYARDLTLTCRPLDSNVELSKSTNITGNATANGSRILVMGTNDPALTITASTTSGSAVEWTRTAGNAATVEKASNSNNGIVTPSATATGVVTLRARVQTGSSTYITHTITVHIVSMPAQISVSPSPVNVGATTTASVTISALPTGTGATPVYAWSSGNQLSRTPPATETTSATFTGANAGTATITFTATWAGTTANSYLGRITRTVNVTVQGSDKANGIILSPTSLPTMIPGETKPITAATNPSPISRTHSFIWDSNNTDCVEVKPSGLLNVNCEIKALWEGSAKVIVTLKQADLADIVTEIEVKVEWPTFSIDGPSQINTDAASAQYRCSRDLPANYKIIWSGDNESVASISEEGLLIPNSAGSVNVIAELYYNNTSTGTSVRRNVTITDESIP